VYDEEAEDEEAEDDEDAEDTTDETYSPDSDLSGQEDGGSPRARFSERHPKRSRLVNDEGSGRDFSNARNQGPGRWDKARVKRPC
jgi:hypothetical protein